MCADFFAVITHDLIASFHALNAFAHTSETIPAISQQAA